MTEKITGFRLWFHYVDESRELVVDYTPIATYEGGGEHLMSVYHIQLRTGPGEIADEMQRKLARLADYMRDLLPAPEVELAGHRLKGDPLLDYYQVQPGPTVNAVYYATAGTRNPTSVRVEDQLPEAAKRLIDNLFPMMEQLAWDDLRKRLGGPGQVRREKKKVLISYRKGTGERKPFVEAIANRLGREGSLPWYDEWEIKAGDSIARELAAGLDNVYAIVLILTPDYPGERWAREEFETAITKRIEQGIRVIPVIYEPCQPPELIRALRYVDCTDHEEAQIERQFSNLIDALNEIELNPYR